MHAYAAALATYRRRVAPKTLHICAGIKTTLLSNFIMNFEFQVTNCENGHSSPLCDDYEELRPRTNTEYGHSILCSSVREPYTTNGFSRAPLVSRDPQTSSLDRNLPNSRLLLQHSSSSPKPQRKLLPLFSKLKKGHSKSAHSSPAHHSSVRPAAIAEVQDFDSCDSQEPIESNLDFGCRGDTNCWTGSNESFSDLDGGVNRMSSPGPCHFRARSLSCSSYSQTDELSRSSESIPQAATPNSNIIAICAVLRQSDESLNESYTTFERHKSLPSRGKSSGGIMMQKFSKKLSKLSLGGGGGGGMKGSEGSGGGSKKKKNRSNSASYLEGADR